MESFQVLIISFWNPTSEIPQQGIFIQDQAAAICRQRSNVVFLQVNVLNSKNIFLKKEIEESDWYKGKRIVLNIYSGLWKLWYVNPWILEKIIFKTLKGCQTTIKPELIHSNVIFPCGIVGYLLSKRFDAKTIISEHWSKFEKLLHHPLFKRIALRSYKNAAAILCVSEFLAERIRVNTNHENIRIIPNIIDTNIFFYKPDTRKSGKGNILTFLCVANWRLPKRLDLIVESLIGFAIKSDKILELKVAGTGPQIEIIKNKSLPANLKIEWLGYIDKNSIANLLHDTDFFLHASDTETFSIVTAEALATGTPVIASDTGALPGLINSTNGILAENNTLSWIKSMGEIMSQQFDREAIASQNHDRFSAEKIGQSIISQYDIAYGFHL